MNLLIDANISWRIVKILNSYFSKVIHAKDLDVSQPAKDMEIWNFCKINEYTIVTHDEDFQKIILSKGAPPKVIILKTFNKNTLELANLILNQKDEIESFISNPELMILEIF
jgi:predicted nuclease of predicted toxin-antitoxin system